MQQGFSSAEPARAIHPKGSPARSVPSSVMLRTAFSLLLAATSLFAGPQDDQYQLGPDSQVKPGVPQGKVTEHQWNDSKVFPGTQHPYWVYIPAQYDATKPTAVMLFLDGKGFVDLKGSFRVPTVFDNLIAAGDMPPTIGIFVQPGNFPAAKEGEKPRSNRSFEYDSLGNRCAQFMLDEIIPEVGKAYNLSTDPEQRATCGNSSGGICAFTLAWEHPDAFRKVVSHIGSFTNIRGGHVYPALVRKEEKKPLRVFLQEGSNDLDNQFGNWPLANQDMAASLKYAGYDYKLVMGQGTHNTKHGGSIFPDTLRWLWRKTP
jgi:enterochelin esterase-like enzyme